MTDIAVLTCYRPFIDNMFQYHTKQPNDHVFHIIADDRKDPNIVEDIVNGEFVGRVNLRSVASRSEVLEYFKDYGFTDDDYKILNIYPHMFKIFLFPYMYLKQGLKKVYYSDDDVFIFRPLDDMFNNNFLAGPRDLIDKRVKNHLYCSRMFNSPEITSKEVYVQTIALNTGNMVITMDEEFVNECLRVLKHAMRDKDIIDYLTVGMKTNASRGSAFTFEQSMLSYLIYEHSKRHNSPLVEIKRSFTRLEVSTSDKYDMLDKKRIVKTPHVLHYCTGDKKVLVQHIKNSIKNSEKYMKDYIDYSIL